ncbi:hypothetical protein AYI68_g6918 [Smittium mucronatum]|uniref:Uncharacterized protein n=1 Tax=Smittium mucronatum TaxID=133383 RepID=A0A1R0GQ42_9FUNG|nr:hypothetical protein AYI68_g6918 [Smittium mucronatum]
MGLNNIIEDKNRPFQKTKYWKHPVSVKSVMINSDENWNEFYSHISAHNIPISKVYGWIKSVNIQPKNRERIRSNACKLKDESIDFSIQKIEENTS